MQHFLLRFLPALPLQLIFILSHFYDRWWEARKIWGPCRAEKED